MVNYLESEIPFYPTDHCGYIRVKNAKILPEYFAVALEKEGAKAEFDRTNRASIERIKTLSVRIPDRIVQEEVVFKCRQLKKNISEIKQKKKKLLLKKEEVFDKYIK